ncbi:uncharacterized protein LOC134070828 isoform X2 [Sardina pilchardus]
MNLHIALSFLCLCILGLTASQECVNKYVGESYTITLNSPQQDGDMLVWKCDDMIIYKRRKGRVDPAANVDDQGSLTLKNLSKSMTCTYKAEHHDRDGKALKTHSESLCVFQPECVNKYVGESYTIALNSPQQDGDMLVWKCDDTVIYKRRRGKVDPAANVDDQGSLTLTNISKSMACTYKAEHHDDSGRLIIEHSESICVFSRIPDPKLEVECSPSGLATLQCGPKNLPEGITLMWFHNDIEMKNETSNPLELQNYGIKNRYKCRLSYGHDMEDSKEETICEVSEPTCVNKYVGESYTITLNSPQQDGDMLVWKCDDKVIYQRRKGKVDPAANVDDQGSLTLTNISKSMTCTYKAEHHDRDGKALKTHSESLCVFQPKCVNKYVGESYTITLNSPQQDGDMLVWKCDDTIIHKRRRGKVDPAANVDDQGSLTLTNISMTMACTYKAEHHDKNGRLIKEIQDSICVF